MRSEGPVSQPQYAPQAPWQPPQAQPVAPPQQYASSPQWMPQTQPVPPQYAPQGAAAQPGSMQSVGAPAGGISQRRRRKWPLRVLIILAALVVLLVGGWFIAARPILHSIAQNQFDQALSSGNGNILPLPPIISSLTLTEGQLNNLITLSLAPSDPVQNAVTHITPGGVELDFKLYGFACSITAIPVASNGQVIMTQVQVNGILSWVMSSDEMTSTLNMHLQDAVSRIHRQVVGVTLKNGEVDILLGQVVI
jgi:hypothetical protein